MLQCVPGEVLIEILIYLEPSEIMKIKFVNKYFHIFINENIDYILDQIYLYKYSNTSLQNPLFFQSYFKDIHEHLNYKIWNNIEYKYSGCNLDLDGKIYLYGSSNILITYDSYDNIKNTITIQCNSERNKGNIYPSLNGPLIFKCIRDDNFTAIIVEYGYFYYDDDILTKKIIFNLPSYYIKVCFEEQFDFKIITNNINVIDDVNEMLILNLKSDNIKDGILKIFKQKEIHYYTILTDIKDFKLNRYINNFSFMNIVIPKVWYQYKISFIDNNNNDCLDDMYSHSNVRIKKYTHTYLNDLFI